MSFGRQSCFDVRDKLYSLLVLLDIEITPDYQKCALEVYSETILAGVQQINAHESLLIISLKLGWDKAKDRAELIRV